MAGIYTTGSDIVDENAKLNISENIIPQTWYKTVIRDNGKPNLTAIVILSDIVYWYKPTEVREETHPTQSFPKVGAVPFQRERVSLLKEGDHPAGGTIIAKNHPQGGAVFSICFTK